MEFDVPSSPAKSHESSQYSLNGLVNELSFSSAKSLHFSYLVGASAAAAFLSSRFDFSSETSSDSVEEASSESAEPEGVEAGAERVESGSSVESCSFSSAHAPAPTRARAAKTATAIMARRLPLPVDLGSGSCVGDAGEGAPQVWVLSEEPGSGEEGSGCPQALLLVKVWTPMHAEWKTNAKESGKLRINPRHTIDTRVA